MYLGGNINIKSNYSYDYYIVYEINNIRKGVIDYIDNKGFIFAAEIVNNRKDVMLAVIDEKDGIIINDKYKDLFSFIKPSGIKFETPTLNIYWEPFTISYEDVQLTVSKTNAIQNNAKLSPETWAP